MEHATPTPSPDLTLDRRLLLGAAGLAGVAALAVGRAGAGPLNPPAGPVAPTSRPLGEIEPRTMISAATTPGDADSLYVIRTPGSYFLTGPIAGVAGRNGIKIMASDVRIDLRGFGLFGSAGALDGIVMGAAGRRNVSVCDGSVAGWPGIGINFIVNSTEGGRIDRVDASGNGSDGVFLGNSMVATDCTAVGNGGSGLRALDGCILVRCASRENGSGGITLNFGCIAECCTAESNEGGGFGVGARSILRSCSSAGNGGSGFGTIGAENHLEACTASGNDSHGFDFNARDTLSECIAYGNDGNGFTVNHLSLLQSCTAYSNGLAGIEVIDNCIIRGCYCKSNGPFTGTPREGILITNTDNRIEDCHCNGNGIGYRATVGGNFFSRNTSSANTVQNWNIVANNKILVVQAVNAPAVAGNTGGVSLGSADPNANYSF